MKERLIKYLLLIAASLSVIFIFGICFMLFNEGLPIFRHVGVIKFIIGKYWYPTSEPPEFGILPLILGSMCVTFVALLLAVPISIGTAIYIAELAPPGIKELLKPIVELLAAIPSVIYGFFGMVFLAPIIQRVFDIPVGLNCFTASIMLSIMAIPTIATIAEDAITAVPHELRMASYALGALKWDTIRSIVLPAAARGIVAAVILGFGRVIGETMTVLMVAGGAPVIPRSIFQPVRTMTATIAAEMGETTFGGLHYHALFGIGVVLFVITLAANLVVDWWVHRRS